MSRLLPGVRYKLPVSMRVISSFVISSSYRFLQRWLTRITSINPANEKECAASFACAVFIYRKECASSLKCTATARMLTGSLYLTPGNKRDIIHVM